MHQSDIGRHTLLSIMRHLIGRATPLQYTVSALMFKLPRIEMSHFPDFVSKALVAA